MGTLIMHLITLLIMHHTMPQGHTMLPDHIMPLALIMLEGLIMEGYI